jgi:hypothetical protein
MLAMSSLWRTNSGRSSAPTQAVSAIPGQGLANGALGLGLLLVEAQRFVQASLEERPKVADAADRDDAVEPPPFGFGERTVETPHPRRELPPGAVPGDDDRSGDLVRG